jgi:hypothetical protein
MLILSDAQIDALIREAKSVPPGLTPLGKLAQRHQHRRKDYRVMMGAISTFLNSTRLSI